MVSLRNHTKAWREWAGLTQEQLAARMKIPKRTLANIENSKAGMTCDFLEEFSLIVGCDIVTDPILRSPRQTYEGKTYNEVLKMRVAELLPKMRAKGKIP